MYWKTGIDVQDSDGVSDLDEEDSDNDQVCLL